MLRSLLALLILTALVGGAEAQAPRRPNVLIVLTDDQGLGDFSAEGNPVLKTPNLDNLRAKSLRFTDFHVAPMCTPTRGQLMTGRDAVRNGATSVTGGRSFLRRGLLTLPEFLRRLGYRTGLFGKWHLGDNFPHRPMDRGFDKALYHLGWGMTSAPEFVGKLFNGRYFDNGTEKHFQGYMTDFWFGQAMNWMKECKEKNEPFFCYLPTNAPHGPCIVGEKYSRPYRGGPAGFFGMIANIDENIGRLEEFLRTTGLLEDTIVIFMTDNGGTAGVSVYNAGLRGGKTTFYDGGHRVPCWVSWPGGKLGEPRAIDTPTEVQDLFPTLIDLCGGHAPKEYAFDGTSLAGILRGAEKTLPDRMLVVQYSRAKLTKYESCVIWGKWRLVHGTELYDIHADRAEQHNLAKAEPEIAQKMKEHYERWWAELEPLSRQWVPVAVLGSEQQPVTALTSADWQDIYADNAGHVKDAVGGPRGGVWHVDVAKAGTYEIALRRWPRELDLPLRSPGPEGQGKALPIAVGKLTIAGQKASGDSPGVAASEIVITVELPAGPADLHAWFQDAEGRDLSGAFYAYVHRKK